MRLLLFLSVSFFVLSQNPFAFGEERVEYYKTVGYTLSFPYYYEGLYPLFNPKGEEHFVFHLDSRRWPLRIEYFDEKGKLSNSEEGWAKFELSYDQGGNLTETAFYNSKGEKLRRKIPRKKISLTEPLFLRK